MPTEIIIAIITLSGTIVTALCVAIPTMQKVTSENQATQVKVTMENQSTRDMLDYRITNLEKKQDKYNHLQERTAIVERDLKSAFSKCDNIECEIKELRHIVINPQM